MSAEPGPGLPTRGEAALRQDLGVGLAAGAGPPSSSSHAALLYLSTRSCSSVFLHNAGRCSGASRQVGQHQRLRVRSSRLSHRSVRQFLQKLWPQGNVTGQASNPWQMMQQRSSSASHTGTAGAELEPAMAAQKRRCNLPLRPRVSPAPPSLFLFPCSASSSGELSQQLLVGAA